MVREHGVGDEIVVPPTIHALLQARIDSLDGDVRVVMERGSVEGEVFHRGSVSVLSPDPLRPAVESHLATLVRKELIRSTSPTFPDDEGFRFRHLLIRDAAYEALPKATRAELHERFAEWLSGHDLVESDEIVGYHLEQAHRYRAELDGSDAALGELARRASGCLATAGRGALQRGDFNAGRSLFGRATSLLPEHDEARLALAPDYADTLVESNADEAWEVVSQAREAVDPITRAHAAVSMATMRLYTGASSFEDSEAWRNEARAVFEESGDDYGLARYWWSVAMDLWNTLHVQETAEAAERALAHLERTGERGARLRRMIGSRLGTSYHAGPMPVDEAIAHIRALRADEHGLLAAAWSNVDTGRLHAMKGEVERARELWSDARQVYVDAGLLMTAAHVRPGWSRDRIPGRRPPRPRKRCFGTVSRSSKESASVVSIPPRLSCSRSASTAQERRTRRSRSSARRRATRPPPTISSTSSGSTWSAGCFTHAAASTSKPNSAHVERSRWPKQGTSTTHGHTPVRTSPRSWRCQVGRKEAAEVAAEAFEIFEAKGDVAGCAQFRSRLASLGVEGA